MPCPSKPHTFDPPQPPHPYAHPTPPHPTPPNPTQPHPTPPHPTPPHPTPPHPTPPHPTPTHTPTPSYPALLYPTAHSIPFRRIPPHSDIMCWNVQLSLSNTLSSPPEPLQATQSYHRVLHATSWISYRLAVHWATIRYFT